MRTELDLRAALTVREGLAPAPDRVLAEVRQIAARNRRRRTTGMVAGVILAVVTVPVLLVPGSPADPGRGPAANSPASPAIPSPTAAPLDPGAPRPPFAFTIEAASVAGFEILPNNVNPGRQSAMIRESGGEMSVGAIVVYSPGNPEARVPRDGAEAVEVNGAQGWYDAAAGALGWEYAPNGLAVIHPSQDANALAKDVLVALAEGLRFVAPYAAKVPYRLDYLPPDLKPFHVAQNTGPAWEYRSVVQLMSRDEDRPRAMDITIVEGPPAPNSLWFRYPDWDWSPTTIAGKSARCASLVDGRRCELDFGEFTLSMGCGDLEPDELERLVRGMSFATVGNPSTWYDIDTAIPGLEKP